jgi:hypothetical protein
MLDMPSLIKRWKRVSHGQLELYACCFEPALLTLLDRWANTDGPSSLNKQEDDRWNDCFGAPVHLPVYFYVQEYLQRSCQRLATLQSDPSSRCDTSYHLSFYQATLPYKGYCRPDSQKDQNPVSATIIPSDFPMLVILTQIQYRTPNLIT